MLTLQFVPYSEIEGLDSKSRIGKLLDIVKQSKIVLMQGRLKPEEETLLIMETMAQIKREFKGVEICTIYPEEKDLQFFNKVKKEMVKFLIGHRDGVTIIGPSSIVKEIRRNPNKVELLTMPGVGGFSSKKVTKNASKKGKRRNR
ncbi:MAG: DUF2073 domain-containing protein [Nanoarchaeota archaeon]|nr:DUF2073 domain-containing protein [Nanoarchaeota archaeon]